MQEYVIKSWREISELTLPKHRDPNHHRYRSNFIFRGLPDKDYDLQSTLNRVCGNHLELESALIRNFKKYASDDITHSASIWEILALAQHHGLPTRLLDWSAFPYVAAHFATENLALYNKDAAIWCLDCANYREYLPTALKSRLEAEPAYTFTTEMLSSVIPTLQDFPKRDDRNPYPVIFEPPSIDQRIINQYAYFSVMSSPEVLISQWLEDHPELCYRIIIPAELKLEVRDMLDQINISERMIYPGLDGLCQWLKRYYTPYDSIYPR